jgi:DNA-binding transcriptional regulator YiaG
MSKKAFDKIAAGLVDAIAIAKGEADPAAYRLHVPADIDVLRIRRNMGLTREAFAMRFGLRLGTVRDWEQRKRRPRRRGARAAHRYRERARGRRPRTRRCRGIRPSTHSLTRAGPAI